MFKLGPGQNLEEDEEEEEEIICKKNIYLSLEGETKLSEVRGTRNLDRLYRDSCYLLIHSKLYKKETS